VAGTAYVFHVLSPTVTRVQPRACCTTRQIAPGIAVGYERQSLMVAWRYSAQKPNIDRTSSASCRQGSNRLRRDCWAIFAGDAFGAGVRLLRISSSC
jgi:hypothetical protein